MSRFLWSIGKLVNDPSTTLLNELRQHIFSKQRDTVPTPSDEEHPETPTTSRNEVNCIQLVDAINSPTTSFVHHRYERPETRSRHIQAGSGIIKSRQVSIQCRGSHHTKPTKSTSIEHITVQRLDRSTGESRTAIKIDAQTRPPKLKICKQHRDVVSALRQWPLEEKRNVTSTSTKIAQLKSAFMRIFGSLKLEKIQSIPNYTSRPPEKEVLRLYRIASLDLIINQEKRYRRKSKSRKAVKKLSKTRDSKTICHDINCVQNQE